MVHLRFRVVGATPVDSVRDAFLAADQSNRNSKADDFGEHWLTDSSDVARGIFSSRAFRLLKKASAAAVVEWTDAFSQTSDQALRS